jgi:uncharacterized protein
MLSTPEQHAYQSSVAAVRQRVGQHLQAAQAANDAPAAVAFVVQLHRSVDKAVAQVETQAVARGMPTACQAGCSHCCSLPVHASEPEVLHIAQHFKDGPPQRLLALMQALKARAASGPGTPEPPARRPCVFLVRGLCSIYEIRPARCRKAHSLDAQLCESQAPQIPQHLERILQAEALIQGTTLAYEDQGLSAQGTELGAAMLRVLNDDAALQRWFDERAAHPDTAPQCPTAPTRSQPSPALVD